MFLSPSGSPPQVVLTDADNGLPVEVVVGTTIVVELKAALPSGPLRWTQGGSLNPKVLQMIDLGAGSPRLPLAEFRAIAPGQSGAYAFGPVPADCACALMPIGFLVTVLPVGGVLRGSPLPPSDSSTTAAVPMRSPPATQPSNNLSVPPSSMPPRIELTNADSGQSVVVAVGATIEVDLHVFTAGATSISAPTADHDTVLHRVSATGGASTTSSAVFVAVAPGQSEISALETAPCSGGAACAPFAIGFYVTAVG